MWFPLSVYAVYEVYDMCSRIFTVVRIAARLFFAVLICWHNSIEIDEQTQCPIQRKAFRSTVGEDREDTYYALVGTYTLAQNSSYAWGV